MTVPSTQINTLGDVLAACMNTTGGVAGDNSGCGKLFTLTTPQAGASPTDTVQALLDLANNPTLNTTALYNLVPPSAPFQPTQTIVPPDFRVRLTPASLSGYVLQIGPGTLNFPNTVVATTSASQTVILLNSGSSAITLGPLSLTGTNAAEFARTTMCSSSLASGASCAIQVRSRRRLRERERGICRCRRAVRTRRNMCN